MWDRQEHGDAPRPECPSCGAGDARGLALLPPVVYVSCGACGTAWGIRDRRTVRRPDPAALGKFPSDNDSE